MKTLLLPALLAATVATAAAQTPCTRETVEIRGTPLAITFCTSGPAESAGAVATVPVESTYAANDRSIVQRSSVRFIMGEGPARALESIDLSALGIEGTLHMTLVFNGSAISMEHALLTPGAVRVK